MYNNLPKNLIPPGYTNDLPPLNSPEWWQIKNNIDKWQIEHNKACVVINLNEVEEFFTPQIFNDAEPFTALKVIPEYELYIYKTRIEQGTTKWDYLTDVIKKLNTI